MDFLTVTDPQRRESGARPKGTRGPAVRTGKNGEEPAANLLHECAGGFAVAGIPDWSPPQPTFMRGRSGVGFGRNKKDFDGQSVENAYRMAFERGRA